MEGLLSTGSTLSTQVCQFSGVTCHTSCVRCHILNFILFFTVNKFKDINRPTHLDVYYNFVRMYLTNQLHIFVFFRLFFLQFHSSSSKNRLSTSASISVITISFGVLFCIFLAISTIVGLERSQRWLKVSMKLCIVLSFLAPVSRLDRMYLFSASKPSSDRLPRPWLSFSSITSQL